MSETHPSDGRPARAFSFTSLLKYAAGIFGIIVAGFFIYILFQLTVSKNRYNIETFSVTKRLIENGFTGAVATQHILDAISKFYDESSTHLKRKDLELRPDTTGLAIPESGISVDIIASTIRKLLPSGWVHQISGEFTSSNGATNLRIRRNDEVIYSQTETGPNNVEKLIEEGAFRIIEETQPYVAAGFLYNEHKIDEAEIILNNIIDSKSDDQDSLSYAYVLKGIIAEDQADDSSAEIYFRNAIAANPSIAISYADLSDLQLKQGKIRDADKTMRDAISRNTDDLRDTIVGNSDGQSLHLYYALNLQSLGRFDEAIREYRTAISLDRTNGDPHAAFATLWLAQGRLDQAVREYRKAIHLDPKSAYPHINIGNIWYTKQKFDDAGAEFREAAQLDPKSADAHSGLGAVLQARGKPDDAVAEYREAIRLDPKSADPHIRLGSVLQAQGKLDDAAAEYHEAIRLDPKDFSSHMMVGTLLYSQGKLDDAVVEYREAIRLEPRNSDTSSGSVFIPQTASEAGASDAVLRGRRFAEIHENLATVFRVQDKDDDAAAEYREAMRLAPSNARPHFELGSLLYVQATIAAEAEFAAAVQSRLALEPPDPTLHTLGKFDDAAAEYDEAILLEPQNPNHHIGLASILLELGRLDDAAAEYREAIRLDSGPYAYVTHNNLAEIFLRQGNLDGAAAEYRQAIRKSRDPWPHRLLAQVLDYASKEDKETSPLALRKESCSELQEVAKLWQFDILPDSADIAHSALRSAGRCELLFGVKRGDEEKAAAFP
jgi:tetratricopeptide (TPR) repeat protein